ncbi:DUF4440 domain-containing protein [Pantoea vagans]|uniref:DUF4440 domain-containing protein n=1 Tax=Pantoea vagans TaxID=470934 RepID=UPI001093AAA3|nr:DUF4440 domain-containing protein [Pantoea vagans]QCA06303.1 DUF4440 domain-containing protein [Pantoea vagans]
MNLFMKEVLDTHELIKEWLGNETAKDEVCEDLLARFSPAYSMVTTGGGLLDFTTLNSFFRTQRGARPGLAIEISDMRVIAECDTGATVVYKELQQLPDQSPTLRFSTVVFESKPNGKIIWRHLQETALPQPS